ncbi:zinc dependent phospholipase C family protein [uncultured Desulfuromonas sp.]|uniref:zinc dependent phospholipase C family protein n=1 Tax=uncultured Desulfuromonas sp. TaxID=181013 RepID=UPI002AABB0A6|nr:zinc dependent phospholipase C family protein [uncultured Desulfuromonas sp.]
MTAFLTITTGLFVLLLPDCAWAWGFGVHLQLGNRLLENLSLLSPALQHLLTYYSADFLYGSISADITLGKKYTHYLKHCHSWNMGFKVLDAAENDAQRACAYGYLAHLAADTVAHSYMVPFKMIRSYNTVLLNHAYWELRFESQIPDQIWQEARLLAWLDFKQHDQLLRRVLVNTLFSFGTNKRLFNSMLLISRIRRWQKLLQTVDRHSSWVVGEEERKEYLELAFQAVVSILSDENSPFLQADPTGERAINSAQKIRTNLNALWLDGKLPRAHSDQLIQEFKLEFRQAITDPKRLLKLLADQP